MLDGKVVDTDRQRVKKTSTKGKIIDAWYSGKTHDFGGGIQAIFRSTAFLPGSLRSSPVVVTAASVQDRDGAARPLALVRERFSTVALVWADGGYAGRLVVWAQKVLG